LLGFSDYCLKVNRIWGIQSGFRKKYCSYGKADILRNAMSYVICTIVHEKEWGVLYCIIHKFFSNGSFILLARAGTSILPYFCTAIGSMKPGYKKSICL